MDLIYYKSQYEPIDGKWYFVKKLGSGAFGTVFEVERRDHTNMKAAVKIVSVPANPSEVESYREENYELDEQSISSYFYGFVEEFTKEIQLMSKIKGHGNVVTIEDYDVKKHSDEIGWDIFIRMELLTPMNKYFKDCPPKTSDVIKLGIDICKALEVCQKYKITHRDIKPSNIFLSNNGDYKLGDFGVSRTLEKTSSGLSKKGTYTYMAPEVFKGEAYGSNVDIYSLGIVMYKLLNNNMEPFRTEKTHLDEENALCMRMKGEEIPAPAKADERLSAIVIKACAFNSKDRYESPEQMREELEELKDDSIQSLDSVSEIFQDSGDEKTVGIFDTVENETHEADEDEKTVGIFEPIVACDIGDDKTIGIFDAAADEIQEADEDEKTAGIFDSIAFCDKETISEDKETVEKEKHDSLLYYSNDDKMEELNQQIKDQKCEIADSQPSLSANEIGEGVKQQIVAKKRVRRKYCGISIVLVVVIIISVVALLGSLWTGWLSIAGNQYYIVKGRKAIGKITIENDQYFFDDIGVMQTGWQTINGNTYYFNHRGAMQTGWQTINGNTYYFNHRGAMLTGWQIINGKKYYFNHEGVVVYGKS